MWGWDNLSSIAKRLAFEKGDPIQGLQEDQCPKNVVNQGENSSIRNCKLNSYILNFSYIYKPKLQELWRQLSANWGKPANSSIQSHHSSWYFLDVYSFGFTHWRLYPKCQHCVNGSSSYQMLSRDTDLNVSQDE